MENKKDNDRLVSNLPNMISEALNKELPGTEETQSQTNVDKSSLLDSIKEFLTQSLPGTKEIEKEEQTQSTPPVVVTGTPVHTQA